MKSNLTLTMLFSVAALLGIYLFGSLEGDYVNSKQLFSEKFLEQLNSASLKRGSQEIVISKANQDLSFGLQKNVHKGQWLVSYPEKSPVEIESLNKFLSSISHLQILNQIDSLKAAEFGLVEPQTILTLSSQSEKKELKLGSTNSISKRRYAQLEGTNKVVLLDDAVISSMLKLQLQDLKPLNIPADQIVKFSISGPNSKSFDLKDGVFSSAGESNLDSQLISQYLNSILTTTALKTIHSDSIGGTLESKLSVEWKDANGKLNQSEVEIFSGEGENSVAKLQGAVVWYEYGPEFERLLNKKPENFFNKKLLRSIVLEDFFGSCPDLSPKGSCRVQNLMNVQEMVRRVEVLDIERLPGRLMTPSKPECRLKLDSSKVLFEVGAQVNGEGAEAKESPRFFVADVGSDHYRGVISGLVAKDFCQAIEKLCSQARASCAG